MADLQVADWLLDEMRDLQDDPEYVTQGILLEVAEVLAAERDKQGLDDKELAGRMGHPRYKLARVFRCDHRVTMQDLVSVALALGYSLSAPQLVPIDRDRIQPIEE